MIPSVPTKCQLELYHCQSLSIYEIARLHGVHHATVADHCKRHSLMMKKLYMKTDDQIRERRKYLKALNYTFEQVARMQPLSSADEMQNDKPDFSDIIRKKPVLCRSWSGQLLVN